MLGDFSTFPLHTALLAFYPFLLGWGGGEGLGFLFPHRQLNLHHVFFLSFDVDKYTMKLSPLCVLMFALVLFGFLIPRSMATEPRPRPSCAGLNEYDCNNTDGWVTPGNLECFASFFEWHS